MRTSSSVRSTAAAIGLMGLLLGISPGIGQAQSPPNLGAILVCNEIVLRIRFPGDEASILRRRQIINERIIMAYRQGPVTPASITVRPVGGEWAIYAGPTLLITVDRAHARANGTTPQALAEVWAARFRELMPRCRP